MNRNEFQSNQKNILSDLKQFSKKLKQRNQVLFLCGIYLLVIFVLFIISTIICQYSIYELCHWLKPGKFAFSFAIYAFTIGWYLEYLKDSLSKTTLKAITWAIVIIIFLEMSVMLTQSWMASESYSSLHASVSLTEFIKENLYILSNVLILINTGIAMFITAQFFKTIPLKPKIYLWSIRASFIIFLLSCFLGFLLMIHYGQTNPNPSSLSIPFTQFSTVRDNLISTHFLGIHSIQLIPLMTYYLQNYLGKKFIISTVTIYFCGSILLFLSVNNFFSYL